MTEYTVKVTEYITAWYLNDKRHREDGPAVEHSDGSKVWYLNGKRHRQDGPAVEWKYGGKSWYLNDKRHREDGPAYEGSNGEKKWYIHGKKLTESQFNNHLKTKELSVEQIQELLGYKIKIVE
jgi:hypothetical protein